MPLITRRSSSRGLPRTSVGKCGSICRHCSSFSQNRLLRIVVLLDDRESATDSSGNTFIRF
jgi:hypothetical protein